MSNTTDILSLLEQATNQTASVVKHIPADPEGPLGDPLSALSAVTEALRKDDDLGPIESISSPDPSGMVESVINDTTELEESALYARLTLEKLRHYRPDLIQMITPSKRSKSKPKSTKDPIADFLAYYEVVTTMMVSSPDTVSTRRISNLRKKYLAALSASSVVISAETNVTFAKNGASIDVLWTGPSPDLSSVPDSLKL
jgi:hypothetical protein